jgi:hypothetical protein
LAAACVAETRESSAVMRSQLILQAVREPIALFDDNLHSVAGRIRLSASCTGWTRESTRSRWMQIGDGAWSDSVLLQRLTDVLLRDRELWDYDMIQRTVDGDRSPRGDQCAPAAAEETDAPRCC